MVPKLTKEERRAAAAKAIEARRARAKALADVRAGAASVSEVVAKGQGGDEACSRMRARDLIRAVPGYGEARTDRLMAELGIAPTRRLKGLGKKQVKALREILG